MIRIDEADDSEIDEEKLKKEEGGIISYLDEPEYEANEQQGFQITLGIPFKVIQIY